MSASTASLTPEQTPTPAPTPSSNATLTAKPQRVLACTLCQQRKVKCNRKFPCSNCVRAGAQCVPASAPRQRRPRFPERELLERVKRYEDLLRQNKINFEPLHATAAAGKENCASEDDEAQSDLSMAKTPAESQRVGELDPESRFPDSTNLWIRNLCHAMSQIGFLHENDDMREVVLKHAYEGTSQSESNDHDHLLFGSPIPNVHLASLHPDQIQIFRLWQIYLENVNPLLKVTHMPTLQVHIIDAARDVANMSPTLEALIFSIYCVSVLSLAEEECLTTFGSQRKDLLANYQFACQQALLKCGAWRSGDRDSLTALYLYLLSVRPQIDPRSLSSMLAVAIRIAHNMGLHDESAYARCNALEAEMRRRLWWSLVIFDNRVSEIVNYKTATLAPTWDCRTPLNVDDSEIRPGMKSPPASHERPTEAIFTVVRSELGDFALHHAYHFHINLIHPSSNIVARPKYTRNGPVLQSRDLIALEKTMEDQYLAFCDPDNSLHYITIWTTRGHLAKNRLLDYYSRHSLSSIQQTDAQRNAANSYALSMLECDTKLMTSQLSKGYLWLIIYDFPFPAYVHILQDLKDRPTEHYSKRAWEAMSDNYEAHASEMKQSEPIFIVFSRVVLRTWEVREALARQQENPLEPPRIVSDIRNKLAQMWSKMSQHSNTEQPKGVMATSVDDASMSIPMDFGAYFTDSGLGACSDIPIMDADMSQFWTTVDETFSNSDGYNLNWTQPQF